MEAKDARSVWETPKLIPTPEFVAKSEAADKVRPAPSGEPADGTDGTGRDGGVGRASERGLAGGVGAPPSPELVLASDDREPRRFRRCRLRRMLLELPAGVTVESMVAGEKRRGVD